MPDNYRDYINNPYGTEQKAQSRNTNNWKNSSAFKDVSESQKTVVGDQVMRDAISQITKNYETAMKTNDKFIENANKLLADKNTNGIGIKESAELTQALNQLTESNKHSADVSKQLHDRLATLETESAKVAESLNGMPKTDPNREATAQRLRDLQTDKKNVKDEIAVVDKKIAETNDAIKNLNKVNDVHKERLEKNKEDYGVVGGTIHTVGEEIVGSVSDAASSAGFDSMMAAITSGDWTTVAKILIPAIGVALGIPIVGGMLGGAGGLLGGLLGGAGNILGGGANFLTSLLSGISGLLDNLFDKLDNSVNDAVDIYAEAMGKVNARLFDGDPNKNPFKTLMDDMTANVGSSMVVNQQNMIRAITELADKGINYNLEQRALLTTLSEDLVPTFESLNGTMTRMIRLQQADVTLSQMGTEAILQRTLNAIFKDSSYLNDQYDNVYSAITDALSTQTDTDQLTQLGFTVQKWLGGLYSVGLSETGVSGIAQAINLLGSGDVGKLGDSSAQTLLALASNRAGLSYASLLTEGLTAEDTNNLLKAMVEYLKDIASNTNSNVVKSQWGEILNLQMSDWKAIQNLSETDISSLYNLVTTQETAQTEISTLMESVLPSRIHISEMINNAIDNTMLSFGMGIADDTQKYSTWKLMSLANSLASGLGEGTMGSVLNLFSSVATLAQFSQDILKIPMNLISLLTAGDNAIGNIMAGYQFTMNRGDASYGMSEDEGASYGLSQSSEKFTIDLDDYEDEDLGFDMDEVHGGGISTVRTGRGGSVYGGSSRKFSLDEDIEELDTEDTLSSLEDTSSSLSVLADSFGSGELIERISSSAADQALTTFKQQDEYQSATAQNVISQETVLVRDINDLYAELFEKQTTPIRVAIAKLEDEAQTQLYASVNGITVNISGDEFSGIAGMRG